MAREGIKRDCLCPKARHQHGTVQAYKVDKCGCPDCTKAHTDKARYERRMRAYGRSLDKRVDGTGTRRRLQALVAIGWSQRTLAARLGIEAVTLRGIIHSTGNTVPATADKVARLYDEVWDQPQAGSTRARTHARRQGWAPPMAWDDDTIDDPATRPAGLAIKNTGERTAA